MSLEARGFLAWSALSDSTPAIIRELGCSPDGGKNQELLSIPRIPLVVILLTPRHVKLLDNLDDGIGSHLRAVFPRVSKERHVDVLAAVVDRIPTNTIPYPHRPRGAPQDGCEGISVAYLDSEDATPNLWTHREVSSERDTMTIQQQSSISFNIRSVAPRHKMRKIQLPVANTLFLNGKTSTLMAQRWLQRPNKATERDAFQILEQQSLPEQVVNMTPVPLHERIPVHLLQTCLRRITSPEVVKASVGNIIQRLSSIDGSGASPASQQLEKAIHKSIRDGLMESHRPDIWAFVTPQGLQSIDEVTRKALEEGCRLHKVLSGGGGWGVKQGLLSLDPESQYGASLEEVEDKSLPTFPNDKNGDLQLFRNTVNSGDTVTFYINEVPSGPLQGAKLLRKSKLALCYHLHFGTTPSTMDSARVGAEVRPNAGNTTKVVKLGGFFGALSEQGMGFEGQVSHPHTARVKTKLDAPYISYHVWLGSTLIARAPGQHKDSAWAEELAISMGLEQQEQQALEVLGTRYLSATQAVRDTMATLKREFPNKDKAVAESLDTKVRKRPSMQEIQAVEVLKARYRSATQAVRDTRATLRKNFPDETVMEWLHARGHTVPAVHVATWKLWVESPNSTADITSEGKEHEHNSSDHLSPSQKSHPTSPPVRSDNNSNETQPPIQPLVRKYLRNPTTTKTDPQSKQIAPATSKRLLKGPSSKTPTTSLSSLLYDTPPSDPSLSPSSSESNPLVIPDHLHGEQRYAKAISRQRAERGFVIRTHASGPPKAPGGMWKIPPPDGV